ncbi:MAG: hypothetical protein AAFN93_16850 [Bacteroidota bacterium]
MKKDIPIPKVEGVTIAITKSTTELNETQWRVMLINKNEFDLENTLVVSKGYGLKDGEEQKTSTLRHFLETVPGNDVAQIEIITPEVFHLNNEYWVSYYVNGQVYDKKFVFVSESIKDENITRIDELNEQGILHS